MSDRSVVYVDEPFTPVMLGQRREIAVDLIRLAAVSAHLNRQMFDAEFGADLGSDGLEQAIGRG